MFAARMVTGMTAPTAAEFVFSNVHTDAMRCVCGNTEDYEGFHPADTNGSWMNPGVDKGWDGRTIGCLQCGRCIDTDETVRVPNTDPATLADEYVLLLPVTAPEGTLPGGALPDDVF
jgi:hypothetical protein